MKSLFATLGFVALLGCGGPGAPYQVPVAVVNNTGTAAQFFISVNAPTPGEHFGSVTPTFVGPFVNTDLTLTVPGSASWALFISHTGSPGVRVLPDDSLRGCRTFANEVQIEVDLQGATMHIPEGLC